MLGRDTSRVTTPPDDQGEDVAALIQRRLSELGMTQRRLATVTGIPYSTVNAWATRRRGMGGGIPPDHLRTLAKHLKVKVAEAFEANGRRVPGELNVERETKLLAIYRNLSTDGQRALLQAAEALSRGMRAS
jgi:transcriptional regulator with XRE-family HTH domain